MKIKSLFAVIVLMFSLGAWTEAARGGGKGNGGGKGGGGGGSSSRDWYAAEFAIQDSGDLDNDCSDDPCPYIDDGLDSVSAEFVPAGNPILKLQDSDRYLTIDLGTCVITSPDADDSDTWNLIGSPGDPGDPAVPVDIKPGIATYGGVTVGLGEIVDKAFFGLDIGQAGTTDLAISFEDPYGAAWKWTLRFDPDFGGDQAVVYRDSSVRWIVDTFKEVEGSIVGRTAVLLRQPKKGRTALQEVGTCEMGVEYTVECSDQQARVCVPK